MPESILPPGRSRPSREIVDQLVRTGPLVTFVAAVWILGLITALVLVLWAITAASGDGEASSKVALLVAGVVAAAVLVIPLQLLRYANALRQLSGSQTYFTVEQVLKVQTSFWRAAGVVSCAYLLLLLVALTVQVVSGGGSF